MNIDTVDRPDRVEALMAYLEDSSEKPVTYLYDPPPGVPVRSGSTVKHLMAIRDGRALPGDISLDKQGFAFTPHETRVSNFYDPEEVRAVYYPEVERLVKEA